MKLSQAEMLAMDAAQAENERLAGLVVAVNMGSHGQKHEVENLLKKLTSRNAKPRNNGHAPSNGKSAEEMIQAFESGELFKR